MGAIKGDWLDAIGDEFGKPYYRELYEFVKREYASKRIYPPAEDLFNAFEYTTYENVKVVILGQDPYYNAGQAHGLCFSVLPTVKDIPPSLVNIYTELNNDLGCYIPDNGCLVKWARQGVLLLNTILTVRAHEPMSHSGKGWEQFTDAVIASVNRKATPVVFMLWGKPAQQKASMMTGKNHLILKAPHPSPLSAYRGFFGCGHFGKANEFLAAHGLEPIDWQIENTSKVN